MTNYAKHVSNKATVQTEKARVDQVANNAGGFVFAVTPWQQLDRFLIIGSAGGTYYVSEKKLTKENAAIVEQLLLSDGIKVVERITEISVSGRAAKQDPAIFALALATKPEFSVETRRAAFAALPQVCRTGSQLLMFVAYVSELRGWGKGLHKALVRWFKDKPVKALAYQLAKYGSRSLEGEQAWSQADILRKIKIGSGAKKYGKQKPENFTLSKDQHALINWVTSAKKDLNPAHHAELAVSNPEKFNVIKQKWSAYQEGIKSFEGTDLNYIWAHEKIREIADPKALADFIIKQRLVQESIPKDQLNNKVVWEALLQDMPLTATIRNLGTFAKHGLLDPFGDSLKTVLSRLNDEEALKKARIHPLGVLLALKIYSSGCGMRGTNTWTVNPQVKDALNNAFYKSFGYVQPTGKKLFLALDVSGSMSSPFGGTPISCCEGTAALAMQIARTEQNGSYHIAGFAGGSGYGIGRRNLCDLGISASDSLEVATGKAQKNNFGSTDCSLPVEEALKNNWDVDAFIIMTDSETYGGTRHVFQAMKEYRAKRVADSKMIVVGMTSSGFTINDPTDPLGLDVVGFDTQTPQLISNFIGGNLV